MKSEAKSVEDYINNLPLERKEAISIVRETILENIPIGIEEVMSWGMITYEVPLKKFSKTYNGKPLMFAALASQKNHMAVYLSGIYLSEKLRIKFIADYKETGKRMDLGRSCVRFRKLENLPLELIGAAVSAIDVDEFIDIYNRSRTKK